MSLNLKAIVIRGNNIKEKDKNILLFSLEQGKVWVTFKGVRGDKAKMKYAKEQFCFGDYIIEEGKINNVVTGVDIIEDFNEIAKDIDKYFEGNAMLEVVQKLCFEGARERYEVFMSLINGLKILAFHKVTHLAVLLKFLLNIFEIYGMKLYSEKCSCCGGDFHDNIYINHQVGELVCSSCKTFQCEQISKGEYNLIRLLSSLSYEKLPNFPEEVGQKTLKLLVKNFYNRFSENLNFVGVL